MGQGLPGAGASRNADRPAAVGVLLRTLRQMRGVTQGGWAAQLGYGRKTVQRWETGETVPDASAEAAILAWCQAQGLFSPLAHGPAYGGGTVSAQTVRAALEAARLRARPEPSPSPAPVHLLPREPAPWILPAPLTALIGRETAVDEVARRLATERLVTLTGPGGVGKTRLALAVAERVRHSYADGVAFVDLAPLRDLTQIVPAIARALDMPEHDGPSFETTLRAFLRGKGLLLLLDNFEHLLAAAPLARDLLAAGDGLRLLVTSRARLRISGESEYPLPPLPVPDVEVGTDATALARVPSVALFVARARHVRPNFALSPENAATVAAICRRLDGLPLALELAADRVRILPPGALLPRLDRPFALLADGGRDLPDRQRALRDAVAWSYALLSPADQALFRRLAVFAGACSLEAAEAVCAPDPGAALEVARGLAALAEHSLLVCDTGPDGEPRFRMLETIRAFALEELATRPEERADAERRHAGLSSSFVAEAVS